ncbi:Ankyrin repeat domain-containing protein, chloroplastic, partial [Mucuna pruriens]
NLDNNSSNFNWQTLDKRNEHLSAGEGFYGLQIAIAGAEARCDSVVVVTRSPVPPSLVLPPNPNSPPFSTILFSVSPATTSTTTKDHWPDHRRPLARPPSTFFGEILSSPVTVLFPATFFQRSSRYPNSGIGRFAPLSGINYYELNPKQRMEIKMVSWATISVLTNQFIPSCYRTITESAVDSKLGANFYKIYRNTNKRKLSLSFARDNYKDRGIDTIKISQDVSYFQTEQVGTWEEPDTGSDSECDDEEYEEVEDENFGFESDSEEEGTKPSVVTDVNITSRDNYEELIKKEIEQLLEPEERAILQQNVTPNLEKISTEKWSPLHTLVLSMQMSCVDKLLENGVDIDLPDKEGLTALHKAIIGNKEAVINHLLRRGASPHAKDKDGATPLHYAVQVGAKMTVKLLIKYKADVNAEDNEGWTPLHVAIQSRNRDIAKILLVNGADKTRKNKDGKTVLDLSLCYGKDFKSYDLAKLLKTNPADNTKCLANCGAILDELFKPVIFPHSFYY